MRAAIRSPERRDTTRRGRNNHVRGKLVQSLHVMQKGLFNEVALLDSSGANVLFEQRTGRRGDQRRDLALFFHFYFPQYYSTIF